MYDELIGTLESQGIAFEEDIDAGTVVVDIGAMDKGDLVTLIQAINVQGFPFDIDDAYITVNTGMAGMEEDYMEPDEFADEELDEDYMDMALDDMMGDY